MEALAVLTEDIDAAVDDCWKLEEVELQKPRLGILTKTVKYKEAKFDSDAEAKQLGEALAQYSEAAQGVLASSSLERAIAEQRLLHAHSQLLRDPTCPYIFVIDSLFNAYEAHPSGLLQSLICSTVIGMVGASGESDYAGLLSSIFLHPSALFWSLELMKGSNEVEYVGTILNSLRNKRPHIIMRVLQGIDWAAVRMHANRLVPLLLELVDVDNIQLATFIHQTINTFQEGGSAALEGQFTILVASAQGMCVQEIEAALKMSEGASVFDVRPEILANLCFRPPQSLASAGTALALAKEQNWLTTLVKKSATKWLLALVAVAQALDMTGDETAMNEIAGVAQSILLGFPDLVFDVDELYQLCLMEAPPGREEMLSSVWYPLQLAGILNLTLLLGDDEDHKEQLLQIAFLDNRPCGNFGIQLVAKFIIHAAPEQIEDRRNWNVCFKILSTGASGVLDTIFLETVSIHLIQSAGDCSSFDLLSGGKEDLNRASNSQELSYRKLCCWLTLLTGLLPTVTELLSKLVRAVYYLVAERPERVCILKEALEWKKGDIAHFLKADEPWIVLLGCWLVECHDVDDSQESLVERFLILQEAAIATTENISKYEAGDVAAILLWQNLYLLVCTQTAHQDIFLSLLAPRSDLLQHANTLGHRFHSKNCSLLTSELTRLIDKGSKVDWLTPILGSEKTAVEMRSVDESIHSWVTSTKRPLVQWQIPAPIGMSIKVPPLQAPCHDDVALTVEDILSKQSQQSAQLEVVCQELTFWSRRGEKRQIEDEQGSRDTIIPPLMNSAQQLLWVLVDTWNSDIQILQMEQRALACRRYKRADQEELSTLAEALPDGHSLPPSEMEGYPERWQELKWKINQLTQSKLKSENMRSAAGLLYCLEYALLEFGGFTTKIKAQVVLAIAEALLDGSTPWIAVPYLTDFFQKVLLSNRHEALLDPDAKLNLAPRIALSLSEKRGFLREKEAVVLLKASLDPDDMLDNGKLLEFYSMYQMLLTMADVEAAAPLLTSFDMLRFAILVMQEHERVGHSANDGKPGVTVETLFSLASKCLDTPAVQCNGGALLEGILSSQPASYFAACLAVALSSPASSERTTLFDFLTTVPTDLLPCIVITNALDQLSNALNEGKLIGYDVPFKLMSSLYQSEVLMSNLLVEIDGTKSFSTTSLFWTAHINSRDGGNTAGGTSSDSAENKSLNLVPLAHAAYDVSSCVTSLVKAVFQAALSSGDLDLTSYQISQLFMMLFEPAGVRGSIFLDWLWTLYCRELQPMLSKGVVDSIDGGILSTFRQYWSSLPWKLAQFHVNSPGNIAEIRSLLVSPDKGALVLLQALDWTQPLAKALSSFHDLVRPADEEESRIFSLGDEEAAQEQSLGREHTAWATEIVLMALHAYVMCAKTTLPQWLQDLLSGGLPGMLALADWQHLKDVLVLSTNKEISWLLLPLVQCPTVVEVGVADRIVEAAFTVSQGALMQGSALAANVVSSCLTPLFLASICQGFVLSESGAAEYPGTTQGDMVDLPPDVPPELLEGTVEGRQLALQGEQEASVPLIEILSCFKLKGEHHQNILQRALLPLALQHASVELINVALPVDKERSSGLPFVIWGQQALSASLTAPTLSADQLRLQVVYHVLKVCIQPPFTIVLTDTTLPFANADVPYMIQDQHVVYLAPGAEQPLGLGSNSKVGETLRRQFSNLMSGHSKSGESSGEASGTAVLAEHETAVSISKELVHTVAGNAGPFAGCFLKALFDCEGMRPDIGEVLLARNRDIQTLNFAALAIDTVPADRLLTIAAQGASENRPLTSALALKCLRQRFDDFSRCAQMPVSWQQAVADVLILAATQCETVYPLNGAYLWFECLYWLSHDKWRRLPPAGPHVDALARFLEFLDELVATFQLKVLESRPPHRAKHEESAPLPAGVAHDEGRAVRSIMKDAKRGVKASWSTLVSNLPFKSKEEHPIIGSLSEAPLQTPVPPVKTHQRSRSLLRTISELEEPKKEPSALKKLGAALRGSHPASRRSAALPAELESEFSLVLIAFAVSCYVRSVLCPFLAAHGSGASTPTGLMHHHRTQSSMGREEGFLKAFEELVEERYFIDKLEELKGMFQPPPPVLNEFSTHLKCRLIAPTTPVEDFVDEVSRLLL